MRIGGFAYAGWAQQSEVAGVGGSHSDLTAGRVDKNDEVTVQKAQRISVQRRIAPSQTRRSTPDNNEHLLPISAARCSLEGVAWRFQMNVQGEAARGY